VLGPFSCGRRGRRADDKEFSYWGDRKDYVVARRSVSRLLRIVPDRTRGDRPTVTEEKRV
jgi:hypothetical protein